MRGRAPSRTGHGVLAGAAIAALACGARPSAGWAQGLSSGPALPATGLDTAQIGDLRGALESYLPNAPVRAVGRNWQVSPSIGVDIGLTDNANRVSSPRRADVFALISPNILVNGDTAHIQANVSYTPTISIYANNGSQNRIDHSGQAGALVTFVPDTLFLDLRGSASESSLSGGFGTSDQRGFNRNNQVTTVALSATPYAQRRFGGWGTAVASYTVSQTFQNTSNGTTLAANSGSNSQGIQPFFSTGDLTTQRERLSFVTGENLGRVNNSTFVSATQYDGFGSYNGAYRNEVSNTTGYGITRAITALATVGYQDLHYGGVFPYNVRQPLWSVGGRYAPSPNLNLTLTYGRRDALEDFAADGSWFPTARTAVFVRYSTGLSSAAEDYQNTLTTTNVGATGLLTDRTTGAPVSSGTGFFGNQNSLYQVRRASITGLLNYDRDSFTASVTNEQRTAVSNSAANTGQAVIPAGTSTNGTFGTVTWGHQLSDRLTSNVSASYGVNDNGTALGLGSGSQTSFTGAASLNYVFSQTLTGRVVYTHTSVSGAGANGLGNGIGFGGIGFNSGNYTENALLAGLRKSF